MATHVQDNKIAANNPGLGYGDPEPFVPQGNQIAHTNNNSVYSSEKNTPGRLVVCTGRLIACTSNNLTHADKNMLSRFYLCPFANMNECEPN